MNSLSVIIPVYNNEHTIEKCITSLISNTSDIEFIFIDDGSTDNSSYIIKKYQSNYSNIRYFYKANSGVSDSRNLGLEKAKNRLIAFVDGDDFLEKYTYDNILDNWNERCSLFVFDYSIKSGNSINKSVLNLTNSEIFLQSENEKSEYINSLLNLNKVPHIGHSIWNKIFQREIIVKYNIKFNKSIIIGEDLLFLLHYLKHTDCLMTTISAYYYYVRHDSSVMNSSTKDFLPLYDKLSNEIGALRNYLNIANFKCNYLSNMVFYVLNSKYYKNLSLGEKAKYLSSIRETNIINSLDNYEGISLKRKVIIKLIKYNMNYIAIFIIELNDIIRKI